MFPNLSDWKTIFEKRNYKTLKYVCRPSLRKTKIQYFAEEKTKSRKLKFFFWVFRWFFPLLGVWNTEMCPSITSVLWGLDFYLIFTYSICFWVILRPSGLFVSSQLIWVCLIFFLIIGTNKRICGNKECNFLL